MAKKSQRRPVRHDRDQSGCMWGIISMFDFRHGQTTQKLLSDRRRGTRHVAAAGKAISKPDLLINLDGNCEGSASGEESTIAVADAGKPSVKKLMEEEMFCEKDTKKEIDIAEAEPKQSNPEDGGHKKKSRKRTNRSRSKSCEIYIEDLGAADLELERPDIENSEKQSTNNLDMDAMMEELCHHIRRISGTKHGQHEEDYNEPKQKNPDFEKKLSEVIELFISQRLINGKHVPGTGEIYPSEELKDALKVLSSDEELSLKLLQGPKSVMVKYVENLYNSRKEQDRISRPIVGSKLSEQEVHGLKQSEEVIHNKQRKFFGRKAKSVDKNPSKGAKASQASNTIVILKPSPVGLEKPNAEGSQGPAPQSPFNISNKGPNERVGSHFFLTEIKRRLKQAMGKEQQEVPPDGVPKRFFRQQRAKGDCDKRYKEIVGRNSPSKDHFFIEKIVKQGEKTDKLKGCEISKDHGTAVYPRQRLSNIYIEAKKHLSDMFTSGTEDVDFSSRQVPKTLGRILSLPEYSISPIGSPGRDWGQSFVTAQMRLSANDKFQKQENSVSHLGRMTLNSETKLCASDDSANDKAEVSSNPNSGVSNELVNDNQMEKISSSTGDGMNIEADVDVVKATEILIEEDSNVMDTLSEPSKSAMTRDDQNAGIPEICDSKGYSECPEHDLHEENQPPSSILTSPSTSSFTKKVDDLEGAVEVSERWSPVSVLEPLFIEEDISPASIRSQPAELSMQPLRIQFEEHDLSAADLGTHLKSCVEDKESIFEYVKAVLQASELNWDEFYIMSCSSDPLLDPSIFDEVGFLPDQLCYDKKLLFDCINEVLLEVYERYFGFPLGLSFAKSTIRPVPDMKNAIREVWKGVCWYLLPLPLPHTLEQIVKKDMAKNGMWMDMRCDSEAMIIEIGEAIFNDLMAETVLSCVNESSQIENGLLPVEVEG